MLVLAAVTGERAGFARALGALEHLPAVPIVDPARGVLEIEPAVGVAEQGVQLERRAGDGRLIITQRSAQRALAVARGPVRYRHVDVVLELFVEARTEHLEQQPLCPGPIDEANLESASTCDIT